MTVFYSPILTKHLGPLALLSQKAPFRQATAFEAFHRIFPHLMPPRQLPAPKSPLNVQGQMALKAPLQQFAARKKSDPVRAFSQGWGLGGFGVLSGGSAEIIPGVTMDGAAASDFLAGRKSCTNPSYTWPPLSGGVSTDYSKAIAHASALMATPDGLNAVVGWRNQVDSLVSLAERHHRAKITPKEPFWCEYAESTEQALYNAFQRLHAGINAILNVPLPKGVTANGPPVQTIPTNVSVNEQGGLVVAYGGTSGRLPLTLGNRTGGSSLSTTVGASTATPSGSRFNMLWIAGGALLIGGVVFWQMSR